MKVDSVSSAGSIPNVAPAAPLPHAVESSGYAPAPASNSATPPAAPVQPPLSAEAAQAVAHQINNFLAESAAGVEIAFDAPANRFIVRVVNSATNEVIRQMPSEEMLAIASSLDHAAGLLLKQRA